MSAPASAHAHQLAAWRQLWRLLLADPPTAEPIAAAGREPASTTDAGTEPAADQPAPPGAGKPKAARRI